MGWGILSDKKKSDRKWLAELEQGGITEETAQTCPFCQGKLTRLTDSAMDQRIGLSVFSHFLCAFLCFQSSAQSPSEMRGEIQITVIFVNTSGTEAERYLRPRAANLVHPHGDLLLHKSIWNDCSHRLGQTPEIS